MQFLSKLSKNNVKNSPAPKTHETSKVLCDHGHSIEKTKVEQQLDPNNISNYFYCTICLKEQLKCQPYWRCNTCFENGTKYNSSDGCFNMCTDCESLDKNKRIDSQIAVQMFWNIEYNEVNLFLNALKRISNDSSIDKDFILNKWNEKYTGHSLLSKAVSKSCVSIIEALVKDYKNKLDVNHACIGKHKGTTPLWFACESNNLMIIKLLLENGADCNTIDPTDNTTCLWKACGHGNVDMIKMLCKYGLDFKKVINLKQSLKGYSAFHLMCEQGHLECLKYILGV